MRLFLLWTVTAGALALGCNSATTCAGAGCGDLGAADLAQDPAAARYTALVIDPPSATLTADGVKRPIQAFTVRGKRADGALSSPLTGTWSLSSPQLGSIDRGAGLFTASGEAGGAIQVHVEVAQTGGALGADASLRVVVQRTLVLPGAPADAASKFSAAPVQDPAREASVVYPLKDAVLPQNIYPIEIQWLTGATGDLFRLTLKKTDISVVAYSQHTGAAFTRSWPVDNSAWRALAQSDPDEALTLTVDRYEAASKAVIAGTPLSIRLVKGALLGSIYYWAIEQGRILRIDDGSGAAVPFMPYPPASPLDGQVCIGCHAISPDGRYMVGRLGLGINVGTIFDLTQDLTTNPPPTVLPISKDGARWQFGTFSPDSARLMTTTFDTKMQLLDPKTGAVVPPVKGALPTSAIYPRWSPDGKLIAYTSGADDWGGQPTLGDLSTLPVTDTDSFGAGQVLLRAADVPNPSPPGTVISYPTFSPDSQWLAFGHGPLARSQDGKGAVYMIPAAGGKVARLGRAMGAGLDNFVPEFSPFHTAGYFWMMFLSRRDYGNELAGTRGSGLQQLWVTAIRDKPTAGEDPSEVAFWLPGQSVKTRNISGYWAPKACRRDLDVCSVGSECCSGLCAQNRCTPPPVDRCRTEGQTCGGSGCCAGLLCDRTNVCSAPLG